MAENIFHINGRIIDQTEQGVEGLRIEAWDKDLFFDDFVGSAETDAEGFFEIHQFNEKYFKELIARRPDLYFKLFIGEESIPAQEFELTVTPPHGEPITGRGDSVFWKLASGETEVSIRLAQPVASQSFKVKGTVLHPDGTPVAGATVKAFDKDLRHEELLGQKLTDAAGQYAITYTADQFLRAEKEHADLIVRVYEQEDIAAAASPIVFNAKPVEVVDLTLGGETYQGPSEYETLLAALIPVLDGATLQELNEDDITFLVGETGIERQRIVCLNRAAKLALTVDHSDLPTEVFYGFARKGLPTGNLTELLSRPLPVLRQTLEEALQENIVPASLEEQLDAIVAVLQAFMVQQASETPEGGTTVFVAILDTCDSLSSKKDKFLEFLTAYDGSIQNIWEELQQNQIFNSQEVEDLRFTLQFATLSRYHVPLVGALQKLRTEPLPGFSDTPLQNIRDLARFSTEDWRGLLQLSVNGVPIGFPADTPGENDDEKAHNYAEHLFRQVEAAFPTAAVAYQVAQADTNVWPEHVALSDFLKQHSNFDLAKTRVDAYFHNSFRPLERFSTTTEADTFKQELKTLQRLFQVSPRFDHIDALRQAGFTCARSIARLTRDSFVEQYAAVLGDTNSAGAMYETAAQRTALVNLVWSKRAWDFNKVQPAMIPPAPTPPDSFIEENIPNWTTLFGSPDYCACEHCRSVYSPAAYLVDCFQFLRWASITTAESAWKNGLEVLFNRRPDLEHIKLSCAKTNTPLPYVDLVNEILEQVVMSGQALSTPGHLWPQTTWSAEELAANPEHINRTVYDVVLPGQIYPWNLPFDLNSTEARIYLKHLGVPRYQLMETFYSIPPISNSVSRNEAIIREQLELTETEWNLLIGQSHDEPSEWRWLWGLAETNNEIPNPYKPNEPVCGRWDEVLQHCWVFLERSGLSFDDLTELLQLSFINPSGTISLQGTETCKIEEIRLVFPDDEASESSSSKAALRRICLFVRLQRRLGWTPRELDQALAAFDKQQIDLDFLIKVAHIQRLREQLPVSLPEMLCWWGDIPTNRPEENTPSMFETLFLNNSVLPQEASNKTEWKRFQDLLTNPIPGNPGKISDSLPRVTAALGASAEHVLLLLNWMPPWPLDPPPDWDMLTLPNLSRLYRIFSLCRALKLSVQEFVALIEMRGRVLDPLPTGAAKPTENLLHLVNDLQQLRRSGFKILELDYLLCHHFESPATENAKLRELTLALEQLRVGLRKIGDEHSVQPDPTGDLTRRRLESLGWAQARIDEAIAMLNNTKVYAVTLERLPKDLSIPSELSQKATYRAETKQLQCIGVMTTSEKDILLNLTCASEDEAYKQDFYNPAIAELFKIPRDFVIRQMRVFKTPPFYASDLEQLPDGWIWPPEFQDRIFYDLAQKKLRLIGPMTEDDKSQLLGLPGDLAYQTAINALYDAQEPLFLTEVDLSALFDNITHVTERFTYVLERLLPYLCATASESFTKQWLTQVLKLEAAITEQLLTAWVTEVFGNGDPSLSAFLDEVFIHRKDTLICEKFDEQQAVRDSLRRQYDTLTKLQKVATLLARLRLNIKEARYLFEKRNTNTAAWLDLDALPVEVKRASALYEGWARLVDVCHLRDRVGSTPPDIFDLFAMAAVAEASEDQGPLLNLIPQRLGWVKEDFDELVEHFKPVSFRDERAFLRLEACFRLCRRMGVSVTQPVKILDWAWGPISSEVVRSIKQAAKAKYDQKQWNAVARPLQDVLREKKRQALVSYLTGLWDWTPEQLYGCYLIDVEMQPCMLTSRIKQAISSVQLFIQRCLLGLEPDVTIEPYAARWWNEWMKNYRVWEANRKIFLYPENWIEPELRDDKSPFFKELENELRQTDITLESAEKAFLHYLEKLDTVSRLEIVAQYYDSENEPHYIFGRTPNTPHLYFWRYRDQYRVWGPWEKIDLDIEGDHLIPAVWNRRLYLFWPVFKEVSKKPAPPAKDQPVAEASKVWEIKMAWSEYWQGKWESKKVTPVPLRPKGEIVVAYRLKMTWHSPIYETLSCDRVKK